MLEAEDLQRKIKEEERKQRRQTLAAEEKLMQKIRKVAVDLHPTTTLPLLSAHTHTCKQ